MKTTEKPTPGEIANNVALVRRKAEAGGALRPAEMCTLYAMSLSTLNRAERRIVGFPKRRKITERCSTYDGYEAIAYEASVQVVAK